MSNAINGQATTQPNEVDGGTSKRKYKEIVIREKNSLAGRGASAPQAQETREVLRDSPVCWFGCSVHNSLFQETRKMI